MMTKRVSIAAVLVALTSSARAEPDRDDTTLDATTRTPGYLSLGMTAGAESVFYLGFTLEGGARLGTTPLYVHGQIERGLASTWLEDGTYQRYRLGIEARSCASRFPACLVAGIDGGARRAQLIYESDSGMQMEEHRTDAIMVPRAGAELGRRVKGRVAIELPIVLGANQTTGLALVTGVGYAF